MEPTTRLQAGEAGNKIDTFHLFDLEDLLPDRQLLVNVSASIISLLSKEYNQGNLVIAQRVLTQTQMRILFPLLAFSPCCPQEVLQASYHCTYEILLQSILSPNANTTAQWNTLVQQYRSLLSEAHQRGTLRVEMRGIYNALFSFRPKLEELGLTVRVRRDGYYLSPISK